MLFRSGRVDLLALPELQMCLADDETLRDMVVTTLLDEVLHLEDPDDLLVMGDAVRNPYLFARNPDWQPAFDMDGPLAVKTRRQMLDRAAADRMPVAAYHFPEPLDRGRLVLDADGGAPFEEGVEQGRERARIRIAGSSWKGRLRGGVRAATRGCWCACAMCWTARLKRASGSG